MEEQAGSGTESTLIRSILLSVAADLCEIGGGYLVWLWSREERAVWAGVIMYAPRP